MKLDPPLCSSERSHQDRDEQTELLAGVECVVELVTQEHVQLQMLRFRLAQPPPTPSMIYTPVINPWRTGEQRPARCASSTSAVAVS